MPRVSTAERERRDALILQLFLAGQSFRSIGRHERVQLSCRGVELAVKRQLAASAQRRAVLTDEAVAVHIERLESLFGVAYGDALRGNMRASEQCRRLLDSIGRLHGLVSGAERPPAEPPGDDDSDDGDDGEDELQRWRREREAKYGS